MAEKRRYFINIYRKGDDLMVADNMITHRTEDEAMKARKMNFADGYFGTAVLEVKTLVDGESGQLNECSMGMKRKLISFVPANE